MGKIKVYGSLGMVGGRQRRTIIAATSRAQAVASLNAAKLRTTLHELSTYWAETGNAVEIAIATTLVGCVFMASSDFGNDFAPYSG